MGVAGATAEPSFILLSGIAGLLAGAFSMAAGEYISVRSQVEVLERQIALERAELAAIPEEEFEELVAIYRSKGLPEADARRFAEHIFQDPEVALQTLVREELGLDQDGISSPWSAAGGSFLAFTIGAVIPVIPFLFGRGDMVLLVSFALSMAALFLLGALVSLLTGRNMVFSGLRQVGNRGQRGDRDVPGRPPHRRQRRRLTDGPGRPCRPARHRGASARILGERTG